MFPIDHYLTYPCSDYFWASRTLTCRPEVQYIATVTLAFVPTKKLSMFLDPLTTLLPDDLNFPKRGKSFKTPCSNPVSVKWTFDQSQLKSFCILQLSGDPFKSAKSRPASGLSPIQTRPKSIFKNVNIFCFLKNNCKYVVFPSKCECYSEGNNNIFLSQECNV